MKQFAKLIEVALPLDAINIASAHEKMPGIGPHPRGLHLWWARRPLAAARAVIFAQLVDDPSAHPDIFPTEKAQEKERLRLFKIIEDMALWENSTNEEVLQRARNEVAQSWRYACAANADHPRAKALFNRDILPGFHDPFAGGGALPLEAQRLGLDAFAGDLNPVAVVVNKAMIEIPPRFADKPPVNSGPRAVGELVSTATRTAEGLSEDVRYYGGWMRDEAKARIGHLYPQVEITADVARERPDLKAEIGKKFTVLTWLWARTVKSPNPAFSHLDVPLVSSYMLSTKAGGEVYVDPLVRGDQYQFIVKLGKPVDVEAAKRGTKVGRGGHFQCLLSGVPIPVEYIREQGIAGTLGARLMAVVARGPRGRVYLSPDRTSEAAALVGQPPWMPDQTINHNPRDIRTQLYGLTRYCDLFTPRQLVAMSVLCDLVTEARDELHRMPLPRDWQPMDCRLETVGLGRMPMPTR